MTKRGIIPQLERSAVICRFAKEIELFRVIDCLKKRGLEIRDIKRFADMVQEGSCRRTLRERELFEARKIPG